MNEQDNRLILEGLIVYYTDGGTFDEVFRGIEGMSRSQYFRLKKEFPDEVAEIDKEARVLALERSEGDYETFRAQILARSKHIQIMAMNGIVEAMPELLRISKGESATAMVDGQERVILCYPRDINEATRILQQLARAGALPESYGAGPVEQQQENRLPMLASARPDFKKLVAETTDGRIIHMSVEEPEVLDAEVVILEP